MAPRSRVTVNINEHFASEGVPTPANVSVRVTSSIPVVAERPLYFRTVLAGGVDGGTDVIGLPLQAPFAAATLGTTVSLREVWAARAMG